MLAELLQQLEHGGRDISSLTVALIFVDPRQILPTNVYILNGNTFKDLRLPVSRKNCNQITNVIARLYQKNGQTKIARTGNAYQKTDPAVLWILNTTKCR